MGQSLVDRGWSNFSQGPGSAWIFFDDQPGTRYAADLSSSWFTGSLVVQDCQIELAQASRIGDRLDLGDLAVPDGEIVLIHQFSSPMFFSHYSTSSLRSHSFVVFRHCSDEGNPANVTGKELSVKYLPDGQLRFYLNVTASLHMIGKNYHFQI